MGGPADARSGHPGCKADGAAVASGETLAQLPQVPFLPVANPLPAPDELYRTSVPPLDSLSWPPSCHGNQWLHVGQSTGRCSNGQKLVNTLCRVKERVWECFTVTSLGEKTSTSPSWKRFWLKYGDILFSWMAFSALEAGPSRPLIARSAVYTLLALRCHCPPPMSGHSSTFLLRVPET